jgi:hypothetical protein
MPRCSRRHARPRAILPCARDTSFTLAQSYRDSGQWAKALEAYLRRAEMGFWIEEVFVSLYQAGLLSEHLGNDTGRRHRALYTGQRSRAHPRRGPSWRRTLVSKPGTIRGWLPVCPKGRGDRPSRRRPVRGALDLRVRIARRVGRQRLRDGEICNMRRRLRAAASRGQATARAAGSRPEEQAICPRRPEKRTQGRQ